MVLMHDLTIDRTTDGKGRVADYTYEELQRIRLVDRDGNVTDYRIPTLAEVLEWGKDKVAFNFDNKYINTKGVGEAERRRRWIITSSSCCRAARGRNTTTSS